MFDEILRELKRMPKTFEVSIDLPLDEKGYLDRLCKQSKCRNNFKVIEQDWVDKIRDEEAWCPKCGGSKESDQFNTPAQQHYIEKVGEAFMAKQMNDMMSRAVRRTRPKTISGGMFGITISVSHTPSRIPAPVAQKANEALRQDFECEQCECRYSTIGAGYFCPACGHNSATRDFDQTMVTTLKAIDLVDALKLTITENSDADLAADIQQQMFEDQVENLVTALQRVTESLYEKIPGQASPPFNVFQRMDQASGLWKSAIGTGYDDILAGHEFEFLKKMVQQRHKFGHAQGIVDERYLQNTGDPHYKAGQRLIVSERDVRELARVTEKLVNGLR